MSAITEQKAALAAVREAWNVFKGLFDPAAETLLTLPELSPVLTEFRRVADAAVKAQPAISAAIKRVGLDPVPPLAQAEDTLSQSVTARITTILRDFEQQSGLQVIDISIDRVNDKVTVGEFTVVR